MLSNHLRVVLVERLPFVFAYNNTSSTGWQPSYTGLLIELFEKILASTKNHTFTYEYYVSNSSGGGSYTNGVWTGVTGELVSGAADVALFPLTRTAARLEVIDCTYSFMDQGLTLLVQSTLQAPGPLSVLAPFKMTLWVTLLCTIIAVALLFWALDVYGRWIRARQTAALRASGLLPPIKASIKGKKERRSHVMTSFMAAAGAPERPDRISWGGQVLYIVYCFFCLIVLSSYTANLTSFLAVQRANDGISGLQDIIQASGQIALNPNGSTADYFANSKDSLTMQLRHAVQYCTPVDVCVSWVRSGRVMAFISDNSVLEYQAMQQPCDLAVAGDAFGPGNLVVGLQKDSWLTPLFNAALQEFNEDGTLSELQRHWFDDRSQCEDVNGQLASNRLTVIQMLGAFVFLAMGVAVAFITGTIENLKWCLMGTSCGCGAGGGSMRDDHPANDINPAGQPPSQRGLISFARGGTFSRIALALLGGNSKFSGSSGAGGGDSAAAAVPAHACPYCSGGRSGFAAIGASGGGDDCKNGFASGGGGGGSVIGVQYHGSTGGAGAGSPFSTAFGGGGSGGGEVIVPMGPDALPGSSGGMGGGGATAAVTATAAMVKPTGKGEIVIIGGCAAAATTAAGTTTAASKTAFASTNGAVTCAAAAATAGPLAPQAPRDGAVASLSYNPSYNAQPTSDQQVASGVQGGGAAGFWGSGEQGAVAGSTTSLSELWDMPAAVTAAAAAMPGSGPAAAGSASLYPGGQWPSPSAPLPQVAPSSPHVQLPLRPPLPPPPPLDEQVPMLHTPWPSGPSGTSSPPGGARRQPTADGGLQPWPAPAALGPLAAAAMAAAAAAEPGTRAPPEQAQRPAAGGGRGTSRKRIGDATQHGPYNRTADTAPRMAEAEMALTTAPLEARGGSGAAATAAAWMLSHGTVGSEEGSLLAAALPSRRFRSKWSDDAADKPSPVVPAPLATAPPAVEPSPSEFRLSP